MTRDIEVGHEVAALGIERTVEEHRLDAVMVVEIFDMPHVGTLTPTCACGFGAQCADTSTPWEPATAAAQSQVVYPPQRVTSIWRQSSASAAPLHRSHSYRSFHWNRRSGQMVQG